MNSLTIKKNEKLNDAMQRLSADILNFADHRTLIRADTGTGKTTWVLEILAKTEKILMLVPLVSQIQQLKALYKDQRDIAFLSGSCSSDFIDDLANMQVIVATYDYLPNLLGKRKNIDWKQYLLVVDEVHKVYSAGSYRDAALNPVLRQLRLTKQAYTDGGTKARFKGCIMLTATWTEEMARLAQILPERRIMTENKNVLRRNLIVQQYSKADTWHWLCHVAPRAEKQKEQPNPQIVLVRLNSESRMIKAKKVLNALGYSVLLISRKYMSTPDVRTMLKEQKLSGYHVVITTSILDEAINLLNPKGTIDSVHIVDGTAHPEEIVQFAGRLREATPPIYLHLNHSKWPTTTQAIQPLNDRYTLIKTMASNLQKVVAAHIPLDSTFNTAAFIEEINTTFKRHLDCRLLEQGSKSALINYAGILAATYRLDSSQSYRSFAQFQSRMAALAPNITVRHKLLDDEPDESIKAFLANVQSDEDLERQDQSIVVGDKLQAKYESSKHTSLKDYATECVKKMDERKFVNPYHFQEQALQHQLYHHSVKLSEHVVELEQVKSIVANNETHAVLKFVEVLQDRLVISIHNGLKQRSVAEGWGFKVTADGAVDIVKSALQATATRFPDYKQAVKLGKCRHQGISVLPNHQFKVEPSKALNLIASISNSQDKNKHKPDSRYLLIDGLDFKGYRYHALAPLQPSEHRRLPTAPVTDLESLFDEA